MSDTTVAEVAVWLLAHVEAATRQDGRVYQEHVVWSLRDRFGEDWVYHNANGNPAIDPRVLSAWRKLPGWGEGFRWDRGDRSWVRD